MPIEDFGVKLPSTLITKPIIVQPEVKPPSLAMGEGEKEIETEYYAGFESELKGYGNQATKAQRNVDTTGAALEKARQIRRGRQSTKYGTPAGGAQGFGIKSKEEIKQEALYAQAVDAMSVLTWKQYIMVSLPRLIQSSDVTSIEEAVKLTNPKVYGDAEREWLTNTWNKLKYLTTTQITITASTTNEEARTELLDALLAEQKLPIQSINSLTLDELMKSFHPLASDLPPGMTTDEARDLLSQVEMSPEEQAEIENFRNITQELLNNWKTTSSYFDLLKAGAVESATLPPLTASEFAKLAWTQPWNATMELLEKFNNMVSRPWAAWFITSTPHWDQDSDAAALDRLFQEYREQGESVWDAYSLAFQNWGTNVWLKMFYETIFDPTNYIGLGIATKITKPIKYLGPLVGAIETGWNELWDVPFRGMRTLWNAIPKTPLQHSIAVGKQILMDGRAVLQRIYPNKPSLVRITAPEVISEFKKCIQEAIANPQELGNLRVRLGRQLLDHDFIDAEQMTEILSKAKIGNIDDLITPQALLDLNKDFDLFQVGSVYKSSKELAEQTLARRGSRTVDEITGLAKQLDNLKAKIVSEAMDLKGGTAKEILDGLLRSAEDLDLRKTSSAIYRFANQAGKATSWAGRTIDSITRNNAVSWVERNVASSLANQYLLFTNYGPFNVWENMWRSMLGEGTMLYPLHASPVDELLQKGKGLSNLPYEFVTYQKGLGRMEMAVIDPKTNKTLVFNQGRIPGITKKLPFGFNISIGNSDYVIHSWQQWNDMFGDIGAQQRAWYLSKQFDKQLWKANSTEMQSIADVFTETRGLLDDVKGITKKEKDELERVLFSDAVGSPANILAHDVPLPELERRRALKQINETLNKMNDVYSIHKNTIRNEILDGTIWKDVDGRIEAIKQSIREFNILGLQAESKVLSNMVKDVAEFVPETADDLMRTLGFVSDLTDAIGERISEVRSTIRNRARVLTEAEASNFNEASSKMLGDFLGQADTDMTAMIEAVKANVAKSKVKMTKTQKQRLETLTDALKMRSQNILATRDADRKLLNSYFDKKSPTFVPKNKRSNSFWEKLESERNEKIWAVYRARENELFGQVEEMKLSLMDAMKVKIDLPTAIPPVVGKLTPAHLAYLMGCTGTDLYKGLTRAGAMATIRPKDKFITWAYTKANRYASHLGKTAEEIGFSKDAIGDVWEQMFKNIGIDPKMANAEPLAPAMLQMEQVRQDLQRIRGTKGLPEDDYLKFKNYLNETARKVGDLDIYNKTVTKVEIPATSYELTYPTKDIADTKIEALIRQGHKVDIIESGAEGIKVKVTPKSETVISIPTAEAPVGTSGADNWLNAKEEAMKRSRQQYELDFPDYENHNMVDAAMRIAFPFWTYESQRYPWLLRTFLRRPGTLTGIGRYTEYTDNGYITIPGTDIQFNPLRGTVFMGGFRRLAMRDYPEYYDAMPGMQIIDFVSRLGFYPGAHVMMPIVAFGTVASRKPEWGEVLPAWAKSTLDLARAVAPEQAGAVIDTIFPDRFRDYLTMLTLGEMGYDADAIWNKKATGAKLTPDETALWLKAESTATGLKGIIFEQSGIFRLRPEEYTKVLKDYKLLIEAMTGVSVEIQEQIESRYPVTGKRFADYFPLDILQQKILNEYEGYKRWQGVTTPLYPSGWQIQDIKIRQYYEAVDQLYVEARTIGKFDALGNQTEYSINDLTQQMIDGKINPAQWNSRRGDLLTKAAAASTEMGRLAYPDVPKTLAEREAHWKERGVPVPTYSPDEELLYLYYDIQPEMSYNWETDTMEYNFNLYFAKINAMIDTLTGEYKQKFLDRIQYEWNGMERLYWDVNKEYLRPYNQAKELVLESYSAEQQALIRRYEVARGDERENIKSLPGPDGNLLISGFTSKLSKVRKALRNIDMEMDAWLYFFGITDTFVNSGSETYYKNLTQQYMVDAMAK